MKTTIPNKNDAPSAIAVVAEYLHTLPVDVNEIARALSIPVHKVPLPEGISGRLLKAEREEGRPAYEIEVQASDHPRRQRFTIAHEIAHYVLHRDLIEQSVTDDALYRSDLSDEYEAQANRLAAHILMPMGLVMERLARNGTVDVKELARRFDVSPKAMRIRMDEARRFMVLGRKSGEQLSLPLRSA